MCATCGCMGSKKSAKKAAAPKKAAKKAAAKKMPAFLKKADKKK
jgi:hypothetical protein